MSVKSTLVVFARPLKEGTVKLRLAKQIGDQKALSIYSKLMDLTMSAAKTSGVDTIVYFSDVPKYEHGYVNNIQRGANLGNRMANALSNEINHSRGKVCLIGSDCPDISAEIINQAMEELDDVDVVIGPAKDGGYYLIGMKAPYPSLFEGIYWGENTVLEETLFICNELGLTSKLLPTLKDIDRVEDIPEGW